jgi:voltage-gated potassium channel
MAISCQKHADNYFPVYPCFPDIPDFCKSEAAPVTGICKKCKGHQGSGICEQGMRVLGKTLERRAFGYVFILTLLIAFTGAAAMYAFEEPGAFASYMDALYWTAMRLTTIASDYWPETPEGKTIGFLLSVYSLGVLGYFTATLASFFLGQDADSRKGEIAGAKQLEEMIREVRLLKEELTKAGSAGNKYT